VKPALLADENIPQSVVTGLRAAGFDVVTMREHAPDADDRAVLAHARRLGRWLLTFDGDFGELIFRDGEAPPPAVLYFRLHPIVTEQVLALALRALAAGIDSGFVVVTAAGERLRPFKPPSDSGSN
jgi:predicted nuclease of predicted toxin-antitoxin system